MSWPIFDFSSAPGYTQIFDYSGGTTGQPIYIGWSVPGVATSSPQWKIRKFTYDGNGQVTNIQWANGDVGFNAIWDNRTTITFK
jgi:YD repeat-containing protein